MKRLVMIGYRGSGKSVVGACVAGQLGWEFLDTDDLIESSTACSIAEIFERSGEAEFRRVERRVIRECQDLTDVVIATGGGAVLSEETRRDWCDPETHVVWLTGTADELADRIASDGTTGQRRPSLTGQSVLEEIVTVLETRTPLYAESADTTVATGGRSISQVAEIVLASVPDSRDPDSET